jgi:hypothetical protein
MGVLVFETTGYNNVTNALMVSLVEELLLVNHQVTNRYVLLHLELYFVDGTGQIQTNKKTDIYT